MGEKAQQLNKTPDTVLGKIRNLKFTIPLVLITFLASCESLTKNTQQIIENAKAKWPDKIENVDVGKIENAKNVFKYYKEKPEHNSFLFDSNEAIQKGINFVVEDDSTLRIVYFDKGGNDRNIYFYHFNKNKTMTLKWVERNLLESVGPETPKQKGEVNVNEEDGVIMYFTDGHTYYNIDSRRVQPLHGEAREESQINYITYEKGIAKKFLEERLIEDFSALGKAIEYK